MSYNYAKVAASDQELGYHYDSIQPCDQPSTPSWTTIPITTDPLVSTTMNTTASSARADIPNRGSENDDTNSTQQSHLQQSLYVIPMTPPSHSSSLHTQYRHSPLYQQQQQHQQHRSSPSHRPNSTASSRSVRSSPVPDGGFVDKGWKSVQSLREIILTSMPFVPSTLRPYTLLSDESIQNNGGSVSSFTASTLSSSPTMDLPCSSSSNSNSSSSGSGSAPNRMQSAIQSSIRPANPVDGVFSNISAKPEVEGQKDDERHPPAYESAVQDITPPYFEMTVQSPLSTGDEGSVFGDEILINGLPVGNFFQFLWNITVAVGFQFLGALLTYLLHNSHASRSGSLAGFGITLIMFGVQMRGGLDAIFSSDGTYPSSSDTPYAYNPSIGEVTQITTLPPSPPSSINDIGYMGAPISSPSSYGYGANADTREMDWLQTDIENHWVSSFLIIFGWVIFARALAEYAVAKKSESVLKAQSEREALEGVGIEHEEQDIDAASRSRVVAYLASEEDV